ncbi:MAG: di-trans,poly-cis-decaprenylcistransferase [Nanoarchaeota archaeon]|nr:di-trans,poly-cis-decaprenylcistransferase [Nanoarchaeota archaeon]MBU4283578.1 di-trans,poly-cis-decaprenylcistransferase [Nanoarchaeota archaeon]
MFKKITDILKAREKIHIIKADMPRHIAITMEKELKATQTKDIEEMYNKRNMLINNIISIQIRFNIPIITIFLLSVSAKNSENFSFLMDDLAKFFNELIANKKIHKDQIKVSVLGKWYDLPERVVNPIREIIESTKDYDKFFLNFCVNYDGREEIVDACKLIARQIKSEKIDPESINKQLIKENLYSSYFISPDLIIENNKEFSGLLLWDSKNSMIFFTDKQWYNFTKIDLFRAIEAFQKKLNKK